MRNGVVQRGAGWTCVVELDRDPATGARRQKWLSGFNSEVEASAARDRYVARSLAKRRRENEARLSPLIDGEPASWARGSDGLYLRTKPVQQIWDLIDNTWCPMWVCAFCGNGPVTGHDDDDCCNHPDEGIRSCDSELTYNHEECQWHKT